MEIDFYGITKKTNQFEMVKIFQILLNDAAKNNFNKFNISYKDFERELKKSKLAPKQVLYGFVDEDENFVFYKR